MGSCSALGCTNCWKKGHLMKTIPKDPVRRKQWLSLMNRGDWLPPHATLCEVHFAPEMWEKTREDGSRRLRSNAIPTIFNNPPIPVEKKKRKRSTKTKSQSKTSKGRVTRAAAKASAKQTPKENIETAVDSQLEPQSNTLDTCEVDQGTSRNDIPESSCFTGLKPQPSAFSARQDAQDQVLSGKDNPESSVMVGQSISLNTWQVLPVQSNTSNTLQEDEDKKYIPKFPFLLDHQYTDKVICLVVKDDTVTVKDTPESLSSYLDQMPDMPASKIEKATKSKKQASTVQPSSDEDSSEDSFPEDLGSSEELVTSSIPLENDINEQLRKCQRAYLREKRKAAKNKRLLRNLRRKYQTLSKERSTENEILNYLFSPDQQEYLSKQAKNQTTKFLRWSDETLTNALMLRFSCGSNGYEELLKQKYPLPCVRTLQRHLKEDAGS